MTGNDKGGDSLNSMLQSTIPPVPTADVSVVLPYVQRWTGTVMGCAKPPNLWACCIGGIQRYLSVSAELQGGVEHICLPQLDTC
jgi:hypothetical protein